MSISLFLLQKRKDACLICITLLSTNIQQNNSCEADSCSVGREIPRMFIAVFTKERQLILSWVNLIQSIFQRSRDSSGGIALGYGLDDRGSRVRFPARAGNFSLHHRVQNGSGAHPASYPMGTRGSFPRGKAAGA
jgi:hypothetical protein